MVVLTPFDLEAVLDLVLLHSELDDSGVPMEIIAQIPNPNIQLPSSPPLAPGGPRVADMHMFTAAIQLYAAL